MEDRHSYSKNDMIHEIENTVSFHRGFGETGEVEMVFQFEDTDLTDHGYQIANCPFCGYDRVILTDVRNPEFPTPYQYECANRNCSWSKVEEFSEEFEKKWC